MRSTSKFMEALEDRRLFSSSVSDSVLGLNDNSDPVVTLPLSSTPVDPVVTLPITIAPADSPVILPISFVPVPVTGFHFTPSATPLAARAPNNPHLVSGMLWIISEVALIFSCSRAAKVFVALSLSAAGWRISI